MPLSSIIIKHVSFFCYYTRGCDAVNGLEAMTMVGFARTNTQSG